MVGHLQMEVEYNMIKIDKDISEKWFIVCDKNNKPIFFDKLSIGQELISGQQEVNIFNNHLEFETKLVELGIYEEYLQNKDNE